jgi:ssDNA-binding replication factor A large subunit
MNEVEKRVLENVDLDGTLGYISELIAIPSHGGVESAAQRNVAAKLGTLGLDVDVWEIDFDESTSGRSTSMSSGSIRTSAYPSTGRRGWVSSVPWVEERAGTSSSAAISTRSTLVTRATGRPRP